MQIAPVPKPVTQVLVPDPAAEESGAQLATAEKQIAELTFVTVIVAFLVGRFRKKTPTWLAFILDLLPLPWMYFFTWTLIQIVSDLIPARKHPPFANNAYIAAGLITFFAALIPRRARGIGVGIMGLVLSFLGMCDVLHMRIFGNVMPVGSHGSLTQLWDVRASIMSLFESRDKAILFYFAAAATMLAFWRVKEIPRLRIVRLVAYVVPAAALSYFVMQVRADVTTFLDSKWAREVLNREDQVWNAGFLEAHVREISLNTKHWLEHHSPSSAELEQVEAYYRNEHIDHDTKSLPSFGQYKGKNLLVIQIEAFEEWLIGASFKGQEVTPNLNKLREHGLYYPDIFNLVATTPTADCEYLFLNSNHPLPDGAVAFRRESNHFVTLATTLRDAGYSTVSMHGYRHGMWNRAVLHPRYGFTHSLFGEEIGMLPQIGWGLDDHVLFDKVVAQAKKEPAPWFLYAITLSSHHPYTDIPYNRRRLKLGPLERTMVGEYMHSAAFVDDAIGQLFNQLKAADILKDTIVVMYGDHDGHLHATPRDCQNLASMTNLPHSKTDYIGTGGAQEADDKTDSARFWYRNRIPLLIMLPGSDKPEVAHVYGAQIDFAPTILHYLGMDSPRSFVGHAILPEDVGRLRSALGRARRSLLRSSMTLGSSSAGSSPIAGRPARDLSHARGKGPQRARHVVARHQQRPRQAPRRACRAHHADRQTCRDRRAHWGSLPGGEGVCRARRVRCALPRRHLRDRPARALREAWVDGAVRPWRRLRGGQLGSQRVRGRLRRVSLRGGVQRRQRVRCASASSATACTTAGAHSLCICSPGSETSATPSPLRRTCRPRIPPRASLSSQAPTRGSARSPSRRCSSKVSASSLRRGARREGSQRSPTGRRKRRTLRSSS